MIHCGNKKGKLTIQQFTHSSQLTADWMNFIPQDHFLQKNNLEATEKANLPDLSFRYVLLFINNEPAFAAGFQLLQLNNEHVNSKMVQSWQHMAWQVYTSAARPKLLVGGHLFRHDVGSIFYDASAPDFDIYNCYKEAIDAAMKASCASAVLIKDMPEMLGKYFCNYAPQYIMLRNDISMEMDIPAEWQDIHDYEKALKHKYAQRFRKTRQPWESLTIKQLTTQEVLEQKEQLFALYKQVTTRQQVRIGLLNADFIPVLKAADDRLKVWTIYDGEMLVGFFSAWVYDDVFDMFYIGFDYERNKDLNLYFNILFFAVEQAISFKKSKLILGRTALDAKARLGCTPRYLPTFLYIKNSLIRNRIMQAQKNTNDREGAWESRHPLKSQN